MKVSAVINTYNEEKNIARCLDSVKNFADEIVVVDMHSTDKTIEIAKKHKAKVYLHEYTRYVEPARNFALRQASGDWLLLIDADEELPSALAKKLQEVMKIDRADFVEIPRENIIFGKWIEHTLWWPDYLVRFFRKGKVKFSDKIHVPPATEGNGLTLEAKEENALIHHNFQTISQFMERLNRYSDIQAENLITEDYQFKWQDILVKPTNEFVSRFYFGKGYQDGLHGLVLSLLQAFSELTVYLKVWERQGFEQHEIKNVDRLITEQSNNLLHWRIINTSSLLSKIALKIKKRF